MLTIKDCYIHHNQDGVLFGVQCNCKHILRWEDSGDLCCTMDQTAAALGILEFDCCKCSRKIQPPDQLFRIDNINKLGGISET